MYDLNKTSCTFIALIFKLIDLDHFRNRRNLYDKVPRETFLQFQAWETVYPCKMIAKKKTLSGHVASCLHTSFTFISFTFILIRHFLYIIADNLTIADH